VAQRKRKSARKRQAKSDLEIDPSPRDFVMARLAAGRAAAQAAISAMDEVLNLFVNPDDDRRGKEREELIGEALEALGCACRAVEMAESTFELADLSECEPWDDDGVSDEDDDEDDDDSDEEDEDDEDTD
jgi:hypothetical protein